MLKYIIKRFFISLITVWILATLTFFLVRVLPGDPFSSDKMTPEIKANLMKYYGMDKSVPEQYIRYMANLLKGDLGSSLKYKNRAVSAMIKNAFPKSADLGLRSLGFSIIVGLLLGIVAALNHNKFWDNTSMIIAVIGVSVPSFIIGGLIQYFLGVRLKVLPVAQWKSFAHTIMPTFALGLGTVAQLARLMRTSMLDVVGQDYIKTAKSKGLSTVQVTVKHQIRNAILPVITVLGPLAAALLTGTFVIEQIFAIPGLGSHYIISIQNLDYTMVLGLTIFFGAFLVFMNFLVDIAYGFIDPRIRVGK
ncbi:MAG: ABC transporter permease [Lutispora sp.]|nr:ABC transporter permease [Lutispora sp.]